MFHCVVLVLTSFENNVKTLLVHFVLLSIPNKYFYLKHSAPTCFDTYAAITCSAVNDFTNFKIFIAVPQVEPRLFIITTNIRKILQTGYDIITLKQLWREAYCSTVKDI